MNASSSSALRVAGEFDQGPHGGRERRGLVLRPQHQTGYQENRQAH
jgi:hypothetical protein